MLESSYKYDSLANNREQVKQDCQHVLKNIDQYTGEILFFNHDIGTGKTTQFANIIPELAKDKRILILTYSYQVSSIWKDLIKDVENLSDSIYVVINPSSKLSECRKNRHDFKKLSIQQIYGKHCLKCGQVEDIFPELYKNCLYDYENKILTKQIVITSTGFFFEYQKLFRSFDIIIFDEILTLDKTSHLSLSKMRKIENKLSTVNSDKGKKALRVVKWLLDRLEAADAEFLNSENIKPKLFEYDKDSFVDLLNTWPVSKKQNYYKKQVYSDIMSVFSNSYPVWYCPLFKSVKIKKVEKANNAKYNAIEYKYHDIAFSSKRIININNLDETTVIVLSAVNTKAFIEQLFARKIKAENCFGEKVLNIYPNVISINYKRVPQKSKRTKAGLSNNDFINNKVEKRVRQIVRLFATHQSESSKIAICGIKKVLKDKFIREWDFDVYTDDCINYTVIPFDEKVENQNDSNRMIPALHFGISGLNDFADYRSFLLINNMFLPPFTHYMYCNNAIIDGSDFSLSLHEFYINTSISQVRQLEGRILRFTDDVKLKYIYRLNYYDHIHNYDDSERLASDWLPVYSHPFMVLKSYKNFNKYIRGGYKSSKDIWAIDRIAACINKSFWYNLMEPGIAAEYVHKSNKLLFYVVKYLEHLIREFENNKNDPDIEIPLDILDCKPRTYQKWKLEIAEAIKYINLDHIDINTREISKQLIQQ